MVILIMALLFTSNVYSQVIEEDSALILHSTHCAHKAKMRKFSFSKNVVIDFDDIENEFNISSTITLNNKKVMGCKSTISGEGEVKGVDVISVGSRR
ncbi:MAG: hypothetical protein KC493_01720 [Bacteriovoracaceae bacterium]|nr:hypothetical protein [Bacteriovoracaceae bacterium]